jgi:hypothetical protein
VTTLKPGVVLMDIRVQAVILAYESGLVVPGAESQDGITRT